MINNIRFAGKMVQKHSAALILKQCNAFSSLANINFQDFGNEGENGKNKKCQSLTKRFQEQCGINQDAIKVNKLLAKTQLAYTGKLLRVILHNSQNLETRQPSPKNHTSNNGANQCSADISTQNGKSILNGNTITAKKTAREKVRNFSGKTKKAIKHAFTHLYDLLMNAIEIYKNTA